MKKYILLFLLIQCMVFGQNIQGVQLFNPNTNDNTPVIKFNQQLILKFDDLSNSSTIYRYTFKHYDRNWNEDNLFFTEFAKGSLNDLIDNFQYSFNTYQKYTHYELKFPNDRIQPIISGNFEIIVYKDSASRPLFTKRFSIMEDGASVGVQVSRFLDAKSPNNNQRIEVQSVGNGTSMVSNINSISLNIVQNNNWKNSINNIKPSATLGNKVMFQQQNLVFSGNNEFYYFNNRTLDQAYDMISRVQNDNGIIHTHLYPVWAFPFNYQYQPDVNGAFYFRRTDNGIERNADREGDYSWVHFYLESDPVDKNIYVLGGFNDFTPSEGNKMYYNETLKAYEAKIFLKQGFYNYILATGNSSDKLNYGEVNGSFWQTDNLYQAYLYYRPFGRNYDGLLGYGEFRTPVQFTNEVKNTSIGSRV